MAILCLVTKSFRLVKALLKLGLIYYPIGKTCCCRDLLFSLELTALDDAAMNSPLFMANFTTTPNTPTTHEKNGDELEFEIFLMRNTVG